jgi:hypothetical protein
MSQSLQTRFALGSINDLITPTSTQDYPLGEVIKVYDDDTKVVSEYIYVKSHGALTQYQPYVLDYDGTDAYEVITKAPATLAAPGAKVVVPQVAFTSGYYGWALKKGEGKVLMTAETYAVDDHLQILNTGAALVVDGTTGSTAFSVNTCAVCKEAGTTAVARDCYLIDRQAVVAAT